MKRFTLLVTASLFLAPGLAMAQGTSVVNDDFEGYADQLGI